MMDESDDFLIRKILDLFNLPNFAIFSTSSLSCDTINRATRRRRLTGVGCHRGYIEPLWALHLSSPGVMCRAFQFPTYVCNHNATYIFSTNQF